MKDHSGQLLLDLKNGGNSERILAEIRSELEGMVRDLSQDPRTELDD